MRGGPPGAGASPSSGGRPPGAAKGRGELARPAGPRDLRRMTETSLPPLLLVGCGKMGGAMLAGWLERGLTEAVVVEPNAAAAAAFAGKVTVVPDPASIPAG